MMNRLFLWCLSFIKQFWWWQSVKQRHWFCTETSGGLFLGDAVLLEWSLRKTNRTISFMSIIDIQPWPCSQRVNRERAQRGTAPLPHWRSLWHWNGTQSSYWGLNQVTNSAGRQEHRQWDQSINQWARLRWAASRLENRQQQGRNTAFSLYRKSLTSRLISCRSIY